MSYVSSPGLTTTYQVRLRWTYGTTGRQLFTQIPPSSRHALALPSIVVTADVLWVFSGLQLEQITKLPSNQSASLRSPARHRTCLDLTLHPKEVALLKHTPEGTIREGQLDHLHRVNKLNVTKLKSHRKLREFIQEIHHHWRSCGTKNLAKNWHEENIKKPANWEGVAVEPLLLPQSQQRLLEETAGWTLCNVLINKQIVGFFRLGSD